MDVGTWNLRDDYRAPRASRIFALSTYLRGNQGPEQLLPAPSRTGLSKCVYIALEKSGF